MSASHTAPLRSPTARLPSGRTPNVYSPFAATIRSSPDRLPPTLSVSLMSSPCSVRRTLAEPRSGPAAPALRRIGARARAPIGGSAAAAATAAAAAPAAARGHRAAAARADGHGGKELDRVCVARRARGGGTGFAHRARDLEGLCAL